MKKTTQNIVTTVVVAIAIILAYAWDNLNLKYSVFPVGTIEEGVLSVHFVDVQQADGAFIALPNGETMVIDAGGNSTAEDFVSYIKALNVEKIDYVLGTHPHEDHIGGLDRVIEEFEIGKIYMPYVSAETQTFEDVLSAVENKGKTINTAKSGVVILDEENLKIELLAPVSENYEELNNYSAVAKITYGENSFLFTGDAEKEAENEIYMNLDSDVLKVGHHGSSSSTTNSFLKKVTPDIAVISVGEDNDYGHPASSVVSRLERFGCEIYRTDFNGTVVINSDGEKISCKTEK